MASESKTSDGQQQIAKDQGVISLVDLNSEINLVGMISEYELNNKVGKNWYFDTGATHHICADKTMFTSYTKVRNGVQLFMVDSSTACVVGEGNVTVKMTSGRELVLTNVLHIPESRKNLISGSLLTKSGFWLVF